MSTLRPREDQAKFLPLLDEDGCRSLVAGKVPRYVKAQCALFLRGLSGPASMLREMRKAARRRQGHERTSQG
jgi:hypothetical protein